MGSLRYDPVVNWVDVTQLSIVMPAHNEGDHIERCVTEWYESIILKVPDSELLVVDDASTDATASTLHALQSRMPQLRVLHTPVNVGHGRAVRMGLENSVGEFVFQTDSDRQHSVEDFWLLWAEREANDFVVGVRAARADGLFRLAISRTMRAVNFLLWGAWIADANCPFKLMRRGPLRRVLDRVPSNAFIPMVMVSILARRFGFRVREVRIRHFPRTAGQQSLAGVIRWISIGTRCLRELIELRADPGRLDESQLGRVPTRANLE
jgi:glycosyltransferase involved in cell wall biosynthesis